MPINSLMERIAMAPIMCDGAMKTQLVTEGFRRGLIATREYTFSTAQWNLEHPEVVAAVHQSYLEAGSELILTNTFKASAFHMLNIGHSKTLSNAAHESVKMIDAATRIARRTCGDSAFVLGDIGHVISHMQGPYQQDMKLLGEEFKRQAQAMRDAGADAIIVEYIADPHEMAMAVTASKQVADWPVIATAVFTKGTESGLNDYRTHRSDQTNEVAGIKLDEMIRVAVEAGADVIGAHCGSLLNLTDYLALSKQIIDSPYRPEHMPVLIQPNVLETDKPASNMTQPEQSQVLTKIVCQFLDLGVRILGGCCGTTPQDIHAMTHAMRGYCKSNNASSI